MVPDIFTNHIFTNHIAFMVYRFGWQLVKYLPLLSVIPSDTSLSNIFKHWVLRQSISTGSWTGSSAVFNMFADTCHPIKVLDTKVPRAAENFLWVESRVEESNRCFLSFETQALN